jgi:hypothetical protein
MQGSTKDSISQIPQSQYVKGLCFKARKWVLCVAGEAIDQEYLSGIIVHTTGTLTLIDVDGTELDCGTPTGDPFTVSPVCPASVKTGSTAVVYAVYEA